MTKPINLKEQQNTKISNAPSEPFFIAVEGPIGVGKTTLTKLLTKKLQARCLKEIIEENPYLKNFYQNIEEYAFQTEMFFLCNRIKQLEDTQQQKLKEGLSVVADYSIIKNLIFAGLTLKADHFQKYQRVFEILTRDLPQPDVIIYLHGDVDRLMKRIALRDRPFERNMSRDYMEKLSAAYERYFSFDIPKPSAEKSVMGYTTPAVIAINIRDRDFINQPSDVDYLVEKITETIYQRRKQQC